MSPYCSSVFGIEFLVDVLFYFSTLKISSHYFPKYIIPDEKSTVKLIGVPCKWWVIFLLLSRFPLWCWLLAFLLMCLCVFLFAFILLHICWVSWIYSLRFFLSLFFKIKFGKFSAIISSYIFFPPFSPHLVIFPSQYFGVLDDVLHIKGLLIFFHSFLSLFFCLHNPSCDLFKFADSFFCWFRSTFEPL